MSLSDTQDAGTRERAAGGRDSDRAYWAMDVEPLLDSPQMREMQWKKLLHRLTEAYTHAPYWRRWLDAAGVRPDELKDWSDFARQVPVFTKEDYRALASSHGGDMRLILADLMGGASTELLAVAATSGTSGDPTPYPLTRRDLHLWGELTRRAVWRAGLRPGDFVLQGFGLSMFLAGLPVCMALAEMGVCAIPVGAEAGTAAVLKYARLFHPRGMFCTPSLADYLIQTAERDGTDLRELGIEVIFCGGEPGAGIPAVRNRIERAFGARLYDFAGGLGASCGCPEYGGMHWLVGDLAIMELVDPDSHELIDFEDGAEGLAVFTPLDAPGLLGIRQTNGDLMRVHTKPCACGKTGWRYEIIGRSDDMLKVKGVMVYPAAIEGVIKTFVPRVTGSFRIVLSEPPPRVVPPLRLKIERGTEVAEANLGVLDAEIVEAMQRTLKIRPAIEWLAPDSLPRSAKKTQLIEKSYQS
jgi:phenylacetate-CoA ligase